MTEVLRNVNGYHTFGIITGTACRTRGALALENCLNATRGNCGSFGESDMAERIISLKA